MVNKTKLPNAFEARINELGVNIESVDRAEVYGKNKITEIPNLLGKQNSLKLYMYLAKVGKDKIGPKEAKLGLKIFGPELKEMAHKQKGKHPNIDLLVDIASGKRGPVSIKIIKISKDILPFTKAEIEKIIQKYPQNDLK